GRQPAALRRTGSRPGRPGRRAGGPRETRRAEKPCDRDAVLRRVKRERDRRSVAGVAGDCDAGLEAGQGLASEGTDIHLTSCLSLDVELCRSAPMPTDRWLTLERLYHAALERPAEERAAFLAEACKDETLRREVLELLEQPLMPEFLGGPAIGVAAAMIDD